jgi:predicted lipid-binding transport protein (Tim44 family)
VVGQSLSGLDAASLQKLAVLTATARAKWAAEALRLAHSGSPVTPDQTARLTAARTAFEELVEAYDALRRMVERGYIALK